MWHTKTMDKDIVKAMATTFSEIFAISMFYVIATVIKSTKYGASAIASNVI